MKLTKLSAVMISTVLFAATTTSTFAQETPNDASTVAPVWRTDVTGSFTQQTPILQLVPGGQATSIRLTGISNVQYLDFGVRADELVSSATLNLAFTASPALIPVRSQINVYLNGQLQHSVPITAEALGKLYRTQVSLDPKQVKSNNQIMLEFVGHYQNICERPSSETLWLNVDAKSQLSLVKQKVKITNDLARWPAPFIDTYTNNPSVIPVVFAKAPASDTKKAAAILASLVGKYTQWRGADFPVYYDRVPTDGHFFVFATNSSRPSFLNDLPLVDGPHIFMMDAPESRSDKMLVIAGRDDGDLITAVKALASGSVTVTATYEGKTSRVVITVTEVSVSSKSGVMLQGFNWSSAKRGGDYSWEKRSPYWDYWYKVMIDQGDVIGETFAYVWCPPPSRTDTASSEGYGPTMLNDLNSCYGTEEELSRVIEAIKPAKAIADVVVNHRAGSTCWGDFTNPDWGVVKGSNYQVICSDDEGFTGDTHMSGVPANMRGAPDTGATYAAYRDLDHTNLVVQQGIVDWMNDVLKQAGFVGWRYDYVKGFSGNYVGQYNAGSGAEFSVGEYWPTAGYNSGNPSAWGDEIKRWIEATDNGGTRSKAFDFALKGAMNTVFGNKATGVANSNYQLLADSSNLIMSQPADAVTFIDNHDTGSTQSHWYLDPQDVGTAYAFILTHPGYPCVAWQHYFTYAESGSKVDPEQYIGGNMVPGTENTYRQHIDYLIDLRQRIGIEYDDEVDVVGKSSNYYAGKITGLNGEIVVVIGNGYPPSGEGYAGNNPIYAGTNFAIWEKGVSGTDSIGGGGTEPGETVTLSVNCDVGMGNAIFFTGSFTGANEWKTALRGTYDEATRKWIFEVPAGSFEWKCLKGSYDLGESVTIEGSGLVWESGDNHLSTVTEVNPNF